MKIKYNKEDKTYSFDDNKATELDIGQTIKNNINYWKEKYFELEKNSVPISVIENEIEELSAMKLTDTIAKAGVNFAIITLEDIIYEERRRNNTDD